MVDFSKLSDEDLMKMRATSASSGADLSSISTEDLMKMRFRGGGQATMGAYDDLIPAKAGKLAPGNPYADLIPTSAGASGRYVLDDAPAQSAGASGRFVLDDSGPSLADRALRTVGLGARAVVKGVTAIPAMMAEAAAIPLRALTRGRYFQSPSAVLDRNLTQAGLPEPQNATERITQDVVGGIVRAGRFDERRARYG